MTEQDSKENKTVIRPRSGGRQVVGLLAGFGILALLLTMGILPRLHQKSELKSSAKEEGSSVTSVEIVSPKPAPDNTDVMLPGNIQAVEEAVINARTSGYVRRRYVDIGSKVKRGDLLAEIETPEIDQQLVQAEADKAKSQASVGQSQADVQRLNVGILQAQSEVKRFESNLRLTQAAQKRAESKVLQTKALFATTQAKVQQAKEALGQRRADLEQTQANLGIAAKTLTRWKQLAKSGAVAQQDVDERQAIYDARVANISGGEAAIRSAQADVAAAQANADAAQSDIDAAQDDVEAAKSSVKGAQAALRSSQTNVQAARSSVNVGKASVQAMQAGVASSAANVQRVNTLRQFERITAPFDGVITARNVDTGTLVKADNISAGTSEAAGAGLFTAARSDVLKIQISVPQTFAANIKDGQTAQVLVREFPGRVFNGTVKRTAGALSAASRTLLTEVQIPNAGKTLLPGMYAQVKFSVPHTKSSLRIPANTLISNADGPQVASVDAQNTVHLIKIQILRDYGAELDIASGLAGNERLIANPSDTLHDGSKVEILKTPPAPPAPPAH